jgi:FkbM family methyltransferase
MEKISIDEIYERESIPIHVQMKRDKHPLFIWGIGAVSLWCYKYCVKYNIEVEGWFVNSEKACDILEGKKVYLLSELLCEYKEFSVLIGHSNYDKGKIFLKGLNGCKNIYYLTSITYGIFDCIPEKFIQQHLGEINVIYDGLGDDLSRECFIAYLKARCNDKADYMFSLYNQETTYFKNDIITLGDKEVYLDIGACVGKAIWSFVYEVHGVYDKIIAVEPDAENCKLLKGEIKKRELKNIITENKCLFNKCGKVRFMGGKEQGGINLQADDYVTLEATTIDNLSKQYSQNISIIKINFPFSVSEVLDGGIELLSEKMPKLVIRTGHDENVMLETYETIKRINPDYKIFLRYTLGIPQGLTLFAI